MKPRCEADPKFLWDFTHMFESDEAWESAYAECETAIPALSSLAGTLCDSKETFRAGLDRINETMQKLELVYLYASLHFSSDNSDPKNQTMQGRAVNLIVAANTAVAFLEPEILACDEATIRSYLDTPELEVYRHTVENILRGRAHMLSKEQETMLAALTDEDKYGIVLRAKGIVASQNGGSWIHFDYVPGEPDVREGGAAVIGRLCVIGSKLNIPALSELFGVELA